MTSMILNPIYISGPMTGIPNYNVQAFNNCESFLRKTFPDLEILNPAAQTGLPDLSSVTDESKRMEVWASFMRTDLEMLTKARSIVMLDGWSKSKGATLEYTVATNLGMQLLKYDAVAGEINILSENQMGMKYDTGKLRYDLVPTNAYREVVKGITYGANKYKDNNWKFVPEPFDRYYGAIMRHLEAWRDGERYDPESGLEHLAHAGCSVLFLLWHQLNEKDKEKNSECNS